MSNFIQLHFLTAYPPSNLNRDDLGRPKTAVFGGTQRLRVSSQSLKRAWRTSDAFSNALHDQKGTRTKGLGNELYAKLAEELGEKKADETAKELAKLYGELKSPKKDGEKAAAEAREHETLVFLSPGEQQALETLALKLAKEKRAPTKEELAAFPMSGHGAADIALFGRMLAATPGKNVEAAAQVAHALSVHRVTVEDDFFTAVDDLNKHDEDAGAGHMGSTEFAAALFYEYVCIDRELLLRNLDGNEALAAKTVRALIEACLTASPTGKKNSFASSARASFALAEKGNQQPRSLAVSFLKAVEGADQMVTAIAALKDTRAKMDRAYGACWASEAILDAVGGRGSLKELLDFVAAPSGFEGGKGGAEPTGRGA
ncbi:MAG: type I-E CRISPR-associated protein Cas7/Cse4/CasC [Deltaproteobacteria bacterium]|nr:type I-E CRISPR-associated protein Cas7/Cse4/CasC [Deltaproteobacteria bacterium]